MLDTQTKQRVDTLRDILVGKIPDPKSQIEQITIALIYKFMQDMDNEAVNLGGKASFFVEEYLNTLALPLYRPLSLLFGAPRATVFPSEDIETEYPNQ